MIDQELKELKMESNNHNHYEPHGIVIKTAHEIETEREIDYFKKEATTLCACEKCGATAGLLMVDDTIEFYCEEHLKEMLLEDDGEYLTEWLSGVEDVSY